MSNITQLSKLRNEKWKNSKKERRKRTERSLIMQMSVPRFEADALHGLPGSSLFFSGGKSPDFLII
jgi:hypothetical protein